MNFGLMSTSGACKDIVVIYLLKDLTIERSIFWKIYLLKDLSPASGNSSQLTLLGENPASKIIKNIMKDIVLC